MEKSLTVLIDAGALVLSPLLVPGLRPVAKSAIKGGMAVAAATKGVAASTGEQLQDVVTKAGAELKTVTEAATTTEPTAAEASPAAESTAAPASGVAGVAAAMAPLALSLQPIVKSAIRGGQVLADAAAGVVAEASKQWNDLLADARAEREASAASSVAEAARSEVPNAGMVDIGKATSKPTIAPTSAVAVTSVTPPEAIAAVVVDAVTGPDDVRLIKGIGPKTANLLEESGVTTFKQLAAMDVWELRDILAKGGPRFRSIDPTPWPEEARRMLKARGSQTK